MKSGKICFLIPHLQGGGAERVVGNLVNGLANAGYNVDLVVLSNMAGANRSGIDITKKVNIFELGLEHARTPELPLPKDRTLWMHIKIIFSIIPSCCAFFWKTLPALRQYWNVQKPTVVFCNLCYVAPVMVNRLSKHKTKIVSVEHGSLCHPDFWLRRPSKIFWRLFYKFAYRRADSVVSVSQGLVKEVLALGIPKEKALCIYNPIVNGKLFLMAREELRHPWFCPVKDKPVFLAVGRFSLQKDFATLLKAFKKVTESNDVRLLILGEGPLRGALEKLLQDLCLEGCADILGWEANPLKYMIQSDVFVHSSIFEGFGVVLVEALACGTTIVSTRCPYGPEEILEDGRYGYLVPLGDVDTMAEVMLKALQNPFDKKILRERADAFSFKNAVQAYGQLIESLLSN